jgi:predicted MFS family arabinose efflux permease
VGARTPGRSGRRVPILALLTSEAISNTGSALTRVAIPWFVLETTESATKVGLTSGVEYLALVSAGFLGGPVVDRLGFKKAAIVADLGSGIAVVLIPLLYLTGWLSFWQLLVLVALATLFGIPGLIAHLGLVPALADAAGMPRERANAASQSIGHLSGLAGPVVAGVLVAAVGSSNVLWLDAATFAASAALITLAIPSPRGQAEISAKRAVAETLAEDDGRAGYLARLIEGLCFIWRDRVILSISASSAVANFAYVPVLSVVLVVYAERVFGSAVDLGLMLGGFGAGALAGSTLFSAVGHRLPRRATLAGTSIALSLSTWFLVATPPLPASVAALVFAGMALGPPNPIIYTVMQERTPPRLLGRVTGTFLALANLAVPLGAVLAGYLIDAVGLRFVLAASAAVILLVASYTVLNPAFKEMDESRTTTENDRPEER